MANCLAHARRNFVDVTWCFPDECRYVIETLGKVYKNDAIAKTEKMSPEERLDYHKQNSGPLMSDFESWLTAQINKKLVEPKFRSG